ncbi:MAG: hypothetical protein ACXVYM_04910 [Gaiellaceae bacterium]
MGLLRHRRRPKLRPLDEAQAYARCHGHRNEDVKIVHLEPRRPRYKPHVSGERLREAFEQKLDSREPEEPLELAEVLELPIGSPVEPLLELETPAAADGDG